MLKNTQNVSAIPRDCLKSLHKRTCSYMPRICPDDVECNGLEIGTPHGGFYRADGTSKLVSLCLGLVKALLLFLFRECTSRKAPFPVQNSLMPLLVFEKSHKSALLRAHTFLHKMNNFVVNAACLFWNLRSCKLACKLLVSTFIK